MTAAATRRDAHAPMTADRVTVGWKKGARVATVRAFGFDCGDGHRMHPQGTTGVVQDVRVGCSTVLASGPRGRATFVDVLFDGAVHTVTLCPYQLTRLSAAKE